MKRFAPALAIGISVILLSFACTWTAWAQARPVFAQFSPSLVRTAQPRELSFADRVAYQRAIEEVYWHHRIWPKERPDPRPSLDEVMPLAQLEQEVRDYLRDSQALEDYWRQPVRAEQLQAEMERMAQHSAEPEALRELFTALGNDPFVIAECLVRPTLSKRLLASLCVRDPRAKGAFRFWRARVENPMPNRINAPAADYALPAISDNGLPNDIRTPINLPNGSIPRQACVDAWTATSTTNAPEPRYFHTAVWTGSEMIVWGGESNGFPALVNTGGRYNPTTDSWVATSTANAASARRDFTAIWTGSEMIVWAGFDGNAYVNTGAKYDPTTNSWTATSTVNAPNARSGHTAIWTGTEMIVWGGFFYDGSTHYYNTGGRYNPATNSWTATTTTNAPTRSGHTAVWTGSEMIIWGGTPDGNVGVNTGARYNPVADSWIATSTINAPAPRGGNTAVWTGSEMIIWAGSSNFFFVDTGGKYNPSTDSWTETTTINAPAGRGNHTGIWTGSEMIVWGGNDNGFSDLNTGGKYNPDANSWTPTTTINAPTARSVTTSVWTGGEMIVWGGVSPGKLVNSGGRYCPTAIPPTPTPTPTPVPTPTPTPTTTPTPTPTAFGFVRGNYYTSNYFSRVIKEYNAIGGVVASYTVPSELGEEVRGLAFGPDGLLYANVDRGSDGSAVLALESNGNVVATYAQSASSTGGNLAFGKIAMDNQYLYVSGLDLLTRFHLGDPSSGTTIYTENQIFDVKPLPNGNLFVALAYHVDEITNSGAFVRRIDLTNTEFFTDIRGIEYNPATNILFVTHLGHTGFFDRLMRVNATTGALLSSTGFDAVDLFLDSAGDLLVGSSFENPTFFSQDLVKGGSLNGGQQMFVTQFLPPAQALNISTRMQVDTGNNVLIGGFIITGSTPKNVAVRGIGPSLAQFGIPDALTDPTLELRDSSNALLLQNDDWQDNPAQASQLMALGLALQDPKESGLVTSLQPGAYTSILAGKDNGTGVGLVEVYDTNSGTNSRLGNISTRGLVLAGNNVMIGGFILGGSGGNTHVAVRGIGPSLVKFGIPDALTDPTLELHDGNGAILVSNDNWQDDPVSAGQLTANGLAPQDPLESGIFSSLLPGAFTAIVAGKNGGTGIGLVEIYNLQ